MTPQGGQKALRKSLKISDEKREVIRPKEKGVAARWKFIGRLDWRGVESKLLGGDTPAASGGFFFSK